MSFWACGEAQCQPWALALASREHPAQVGFAPRCTVSLSLREGVCSGEHLLCQPGDPSSGSARLVDKPWWGAWIHCQEEGLATCPWGWDQPSCRGHLQQSQLRAAHCHRPHHSRLIDTYVAATATTPGPVWGVAGGSSAQACSGGSPSQRRSSLQAGKPRAASSVTGGKQGSAGVLKPLSLWLGP